MPTPVSTREQLAAIAVSAATSVEGVAGMRARPGGVHATQVGGERLDGVSVVAAGAGGFDVTLCLLALPVPLHPLAARVREQVQVGAAAAGLPDAVAGIDVRIVAVVDPVEVVTT